MSKRRRNKANRAPNESLTTEEREKLENVPGYKEYVREHNRKMRRLLDNEESPEDWYE